MPDKNISFEEWKKLDIRTGKILKAENHPNADKLYILTVDIGEKEKRKLVASIKEYFQPDELEARPCVVLTNLEPATFRGVKSEGMILAAVERDKQGKERSCILIQTAEKTEPGMKIE